MRATCVLPSCDVSVVELGQLLPQLTDAVDTVVVVVNSPNQQFRDETAAYCSRHRAVRTVVLNDRVGKATAVRQGLQYALEATAADVIVQVDGHLKQDLSRLGYLISSIGSHFDMATYVRYVGVDLPPGSHRRTVRDFTASYVNLLANVRMNDTVCGTRAYRRGLAELFLGGKSSGYGLEVEQVLLTALAGGSICEIPVRSRVQAANTATQKLIENYDVLIEAAGRKHLLQISKSLMRLRTALVAFREHYHELPSGEMVRFIPIEFGEDGEASYMLTQGSS